MKLPTYHARDDGKMAEYTKYPNNEKAHIELHKSSSLLDDLKCFNIPVIEIDADEFIAHKWRVIEFLRAMEVMS